MLSLVTSLALTQPALATPQAPEVCQGEQGEVFELRVTSANASRWGAVAAGRGQALTLSVTTSRNPDRACNTLGFTLLDDNGTDARFALTGQPVGATRVDRGRFTRDYSVELPADLPVGLFTLAYAPDDSSVSAVNSARVFVTFAEPVAVDTVAAALGADRLVLPLSADDVLTFDVDPHAAEVELALMDALLDAGLDERRDPEAVVRRLNAWVSDKMVLWGRWDGAYADGAALRVQVAWGTALGREAAREPWSWTGSTDILRAWAREPSRVRYGQCWVFGGTLTSMTRAIGLPTRVVTNFDSAHERGASGVGTGPAYGPTGPGSWHTNASAKSDSVWNFHVWTETWMTRGGETGWNAYDGTCQEESDGFYVIGDVGSGGTRFRAGALDTNTAFQLDLYGDIGVRFLVGGLGGGAQVFVGSGPIFLRGNPEG